jgi:heat shock protein HslJ
MMQSKMANGFLGIALMYFLVGCGPQGDDGATVDTPAAAAETARPEPSASAAASAERPELAGTSWRLVQIMSMDDTEIVPDDRSKYTLTFTDDGAKILADCNRGTGSYTSQSPGQLMFGVIASTKALCPPDSISDTYMGQFQWVRSYVLENGNLFLATMADGSIIEFEPLPE